MLHHLCKVICATLFFCVIGTGLYAQTASKKPVRKSAAIKTGTAKKATVISNNVTSEPWKALNSKERLVEIKTDFGVMIAKLYNQTPLHRDNFVNLVQQNFYDSLLFHRVINQFMLQGGDPGSKNAGDNVMLGGGAAPGERIPAEFNPQLFHKKGALAAARDNNEAKASSNSQFYIVHGKPIPSQELDNILSQRVKPNNASFEYSPFQKAVYTTLGGTPFLDQSYTVFGEVISGLDVIDKIAGVPTNPGDRPVENVRMTIRLLN